MCPRSDVPLFCTIASLMLPATDLDIVLVLEQWRLHDVSKQKVLRLDVEGISGEVCDAVPMTSLHRFVGHHLQQRTALAEVVDLLFQIKVCLPVLQTLRQLLASTPDQFSFSADHV